MKTYIKTILCIAALLINAASYAQTSNAPVIAVDNMNVLYVGVDNPISIAVPGVASDKLIVTIENGSIINREGKYIVRVSTGTEATIHVSAELKPGETKELGSTKFRIKKIPDPVAYVSGIASTDYYSITKNELLQNPVINVMINVPFELTFTLTSFTFTYSKGSSLITLKAFGNRLDEKMIEAIKSMEDGKKFYLEDIKVVGPDGATRTIGVISVVVRDKP
jgi:gliding motility-associated protein GldM